MIVSLMVNMKNDLAMRCGISNVMKSFIFTLATNINLTEVWHIIFFLSQFQIKLEISFN
jgi:hypothetical protein